VSELPHDPVYHLGQQVRRWENFSPEVQELRWPILIWLEAAVGRMAVEDGLPTGASIKAKDQAGQPFTKYKLIPFDENCDFPHPVGVLAGQGILVGLREQCCAAEWANPQTAFPDLTWIDEPFSVSAGKPGLFWWVTISVDQQWAVRRRLLSQLVSVIHCLERRD